MSTRATQDDGILAVLSPVENIAGQLYCLSPTNDECPRLNGAGIRDYQPDSDFYEAAVPAEALNTDGAIRTNHLDPKWTVEEQVCDYPFLLFIRTWYK